MKGFRKLSSIALLLFAFVYPPSLAQAKDISLSNGINEQSAASEANLIAERKGELLIAQRRSGRYRIIRRRQPLGLGRYQIIRRDPYGRTRIIRRGDRFRRYQNFRQQRLRQREFRRQRYYRQWY
ncbi:MULTISPECIES: hypothetical protein [Nostoc]|uniref:Uncharacterized protein n=1 Tax=Nostoc paludosum FACHB-159 TaxID=2692908 RepID=A0ABR8K2I1_9NOSO|nr:MULTISPECIES: hypothetical protein [Nostoc]MBD2677222.1 hypothetical protein [Nostoc sp. FACHB-857]MBD2732969.1 hypothetical protein [Nostoc paludosum FACHB-159]